MTPPPSKTAGDHGRRKADHLDLCATTDVGFRHKTSLLDQVELIHDALPDLDLAAIDLSTVVVGRRLAAPIVISAMTGGVDRARAINEDLAAAAEATGVAFGFGSMRPLLEDGITAGYRVRHVAPTAPLFANLGVVQARDATLDQLEDLVGTTGCDALCVHLNPAQEVVQAGGDTDFRHGLDTLARLAADLSVPVLVKETGAGLSRRTARRLRDAGIAHVDVSGAGGTSWVAVETLRARARTRALGERFWDWGIPTAASVAQVADLGFETVIATGGVRHGLDIARALALGATAGGMARAFLTAWTEGGRDGVIAAIEAMAHEIRVACLLTGCPRVQDLASVPLVLGAPLLRWVPGDSPLRARLPGPPSPAPGYAPPTKEAP